MAKAAPPPASPAEEAWKKREAGDVYLARKLAQRLLGAGGAEKDLAQARELLERTRLPEVAWHLLLAVAVFIALMMALGAYRT